jgi:hypothetical protein
VILRGFATGLLGRVESPRPRQVDSSNKVAVRLCGPGERVWTINWRRLRPASKEEAERWGRETYAQHVDRVNRTSFIPNMGDADALESE